LRHYAGWVALVAFSSVACWFALYPPSSPSFPPVPQALKRDATQAEIEQTKESLAALRVGIAVSQERMRENDERRWPTVAEVQENRLRLSSGGEVALLAAVDRLPENPLTDGHGAVVHNCAASLTQAAVEGDNADWHYCPETGRLVPSAGVSGLPTHTW